MLSPCVRALQQRITLGLSEWESRGTVLAQALTEIKKVRWENMRSDEQKRFSLSSQIPYRTDKSLMALVKKQTFENTVFQ